jgi:hypothetical protein
MRTSLLLIPLLAATVAGCGQSTPDAAPAPRTAATPDQLAGYSDGVRKYYTGARLSAADAPDADAEEKYFQPPRPAQAGLGRSITLTGANIGVRMKVTVTAVETVHEGGETYSAVDLRLKSTGITIYDGELRSAVVTYPDGTQEPVADGVKAGCSNRFDASVRIDVGRSRSGCLLFRNQGEAPVAKFQLALETIPSEAGGIWELGA